MWYHQIRRFCPHTPIIPVGCKNDTRFIYKDEQYLSYCKERSPLVRYRHVAAFWLKQTFFASHTALTLVMHLGCHKHQTERFFIGKVFY